MSTTASSGDEGNVRSFEKIAVVGLGYIGLPTAAVLASQKAHVVGIDVQPHVVNTINDGQIHIVEPGLEDIVRDAVKDGYLRATLEVEPADAWLIAVPTPITSEKKADLTYVMTAVDAIAPQLRNGDLLILESTSPVGTTEALVERLAAARPDLFFPVRNGDGDHNIYVAYCPERVLPGKVIEELISNDRAIGGITPRCTARAIELYRLFVKGALVATDSRSAELCKLAENAYRDVNIAFANELANVCDHLDMNVWEVIRLANRHPRVNVLSPGPGVGGHCIAVDPWFIAEAAPDDTPVIQSARKVNDDRPGRIIDKVEAKMKEAASRSGKAEGSLTVAFYGLAYKPDIDDLRESAAMKIVSRFVRRHDGRVLVVEPNIHTVPDDLGHAELVQIDQARADADIHVLLVDHQSFRDIAAPGEQFVDAKGPWQAG